MSKSQQDRSGTEPSDLAVLWRQAMIEYYTAASLDPVTMPRYTNLTEILEDRTVQRNFETFRNKGGRVAKLRHLIATNTTMILSSAQYIANAATAAFPPSSAILTALTLVLKASSDISNDYDKIIAFFDELNGFLERVQMIEQKLPQFTGYRNHLIRVFSAILKIFGLTTKATKEGRLKRFGKTLLRGGEDSDLAGAFAGLETALNRLESATGFATLAGVQIIQETAQRIDDKSDQQLNLLYGIGGSLQSSRSENLEWFQEMSTKFDQMLQIQRSAAREAEPQLESQNVDPGLKSRAALRIVNRVFPNKTGPTSQRRELQHTLIDGTGQWFLQRPEVAAWMNRSTEHKILWLTGQAGLGKSCLAFLTNSKLQLSTASNPDYAVATVFFKDIAYDEDISRSFLCSIINQIASRDVEYCEQAAADNLATRSDPSKWNEYTGDVLWTELIASKFRRGSDCFLFLILDGIDECKDPEVGTMIAQRLRQIATKELQIYVLITSRPDWHLGVGVLDQAISKISISPEDLGADMRTLIDTRIRSSSRLYRYRKQIQQLITSHVFEKADSMLYIEHALYLLNRIHQEQLMVRQLKTLPNNLVGLFDLLEDVIHAKRRAQQLDALKTLFAWLAFARRPLTISGANMLLSMQLEDPFFSFEEELSGPAGAFLEIVNISEEVLDDIKDNVKGNGESAGQGGLDVAVFDSFESETGTSVLRFRDRSLREYFILTTNKQGSLQSPRDMSHIIILKLLVSLLCGIGVRQSTDNEVKQDGALTKYATSSWLYHLSSINLENLTEVQVCDVLLSMKLLLTNTNNVAKVIEQNCPVKDPDVSANYSSDWYRKICRQIKPAMIPWLKRGLAVGKNSMSQEEYTWIQRLDEKPSLITSEIAKGHIRNWLGDPEELLTAYKFAWAAIDPDEPTFPQFEYYWHAVKLNALKQMAMIVSPTLDWKAHLSLGVTVRNFGEILDSLTELDFALQMASSNIERAIVLVEIVETGYLDLSEVQTGWKDRDWEFYRATAQLAIDTYPDDQSKDRLHHIRRCILLRARCEQELGSPAKALSSYDEARSLLPNETLNPESYFYFAKFLYEELGPKALLEKVQTWNLFELMAWLCNDFRDEQGSTAYSEEHRTAFFQNAVAVDQGPFVVQVYEAIIGFQEMRGGGTQAKLYLATFYLKYYRSHPQTIEKAKVLLNQVLQSNSQINLATGDNEPERLIQARDQLAEVLYEQFRSASDLSSKQRSLEEMRKIQEENVNNALQDTQPSESSTAIIYACMLRKVSGNIEFSDVLDQVFQSCMGSLSDRHSWNDQASLILLAKVLACAPGLSRDARIAFSAKDSVLNPSVKLISKYGTREQLEPDEKWGDMLPSHPVRCSGNRKHVLNRWDAAPVYLCITCINTYLCAECFEQIQRVNRGEKTWADITDRRFCGENHRYIKGPIEGWKGVRGGEIVIERDGVDTRVPFAGWLEGLKLRWKEAWDVFWKSEDLADVLG